MSTYFHQGTKKYKKVHMIFSSHNSDFFPLANVRTRNSYYLEIKYCEI